ncbi:hypothetical protein FJY93_02390 [Candidatus Kaiserbacteria bacterium]|nr:hypothetical protein [Candidatus Kaiserbacteria bacterium]
MFDYLDKEDKQFAVKTAKIVGVFAVVCVGIFYLTKAAIVYTWMDPRTAVCLAIGFGTMICFGLVLWITHVVGNRAADVASESGYPRLFVLIARNLMWIVVIGTAWSILKFYHFV